MKKYGSSILNTFCIVAIILLGSSKAVQAASAKAAIKPPAPTRTAPKAPGVVNEKAQFKANLAALTTMLSKMSANPQGLDSLLNSTDDQQLKTFNQLFGNVERSLMPLHLKLGKQEPSAPTGGAAAGAKPSHPTVVVPQSPASGSSALSPNKEFQRKSWIAIQRKASEPTSPATPKFDPDATVAASGIPVYVPVLAPSPSDGATLPATALSN